MSILAIQFLQLVTGTFFTLTGSRKVFKPEVRARVLPFIASHQPGNSRALAWATIVGELAGGLGLGYNVLPQYAAGGLLIIMLGAYTTDTIPTMQAKWKPEDSISHKVSNLMCNPEFMLITILITLLLSYWTI